MKTRMKPVLVLSVIFGFVLMLMSVSSASAQEKAAPVEKAAAKVETQTKAMQSSKPAVKMEKTVPQAKKAASTMMSKQEIKSVQMALNKEGYKLTPDGILGKYTKRALREFQKKNGLKATGQPDSQTLAKLNLK
jgi:peptidoglycan hydrolase-like protein with peptidoglycan-binding domain